MTFEEAYSEWQVGRLAFFLFIRSNAAISLMLDGLDSGIQTFGHGVGDAVREEESKAVIQSVG